MSNQYPPPSPPPTGYGSPYGSPQMSNPLTPPGGTGPGGGKTSLGLDSNVGAMLSYLGNLLCCVGGIILSIIFLVTEKDNRFVKFHAIQSLLVSGAGIGVGVILRVMGLILGSVGMGFVLLGLNIIVLVVFLAIWILAGVKAYQGEWFKLPVIGDIAENMTNK
ncbi:MAG: hypothetical protein QOD00_1453 [Blastocatellia bacterium]|jgi:uncharacterized membrane protein|nr:hypothetical protein [Blastocatellia bacterium]